MQIFLSWSGETSHDIAELLRDWLPKVIQSAKPYFTPKDIDKGSKWLNEILKKLNECTVGIICLTPENYEKPWVLFEAGALSNRSDDAIVCPLFFNINKADIKNPLVQVLQGTEFTRKDFYMLISNINKKLGENAVSESILTETFDIFYPQLKK